MRNRKNVKRKLKHKNIINLKDLFIIFKMDLSKVQNDKKLSLCKTYFTIGFFLLPFVWLVNAIWFFNEAFRKPEFEEQKEIKKYVIYSAIGTLVWFIALVVWVIVFQLHRSEWGEYADNISFIIFLNAQPSVIYTTIRNVELVRWFITHVSSII